MLKFIWCKKRTTHLLIIFLNFVRCIDKNEEIFKSQIEKSIQEYVLIKPYKK